MTPKDPFFEGDFLGQILALTLYLIKKPSKMLAPAEDHLATFSFPGVSQTIVKNSTWGQCPQVLAGTARKAAKSTRLCSYICNRVGLLHNGKRAERQMGKKWERRGKFAPIENGKKMAERYRKNGNSGRFSIFSVFFGHFFPILDRGKFSTFFPFFFPFLSFGPFSIV